jgi:hypothetical protein
MAPVNPDGCILIRLTEQEPLAMPTSVRRHIVQNSRNNDTENRDAGLSAFFMRHKHHYQSTYALILLPLRSASRKKLISTWMPDMFVRPWGCESPFVSRRGTWTQGSSLLYSCDCEKSRFGSQCTFSCPWPGTTCSNITSIYVSMKALNVSASL